MSIHVTFLCVTRLYDNKMRSQEDILTQLQNPMYRAALAFTGDSNLAHDMAQEGLLRLWKHRHRWDEIDNLKAWALRIVRNLCIDESRRRKQSEPLEASFGLKTTTPLPDQSAIVNDQMSVLSQALRTLSADQQLAIHLREMEGHTYQEIAQIMNENINKVKILIYRGRQKIKDFFIEKNEYGTRTD